jgi:hypothetical protein
MGDLQSIGYGGQPVREVFRVVRPPGDATCEAADPVLVGEVRSAGRQERLHQALDADTGELPAVLNGAVRQLDPGLGGLSGAGCEQVQAGCGNTQRVLVKITDHSSKVAQKAYQHVDQTRARAALTKLEKLLSA